MRERLFWTVVAFLILGGLRMVYEPCAMPEPRGEQEQQELVIKLKIGELPVMNYREVK